MKTISLLAVSAACLALAACGEATAPAPNADQQAAAEQKQQLAEAQRQIGLPRISNFTEKKLATKIEEMRDDPNLLTYAYLQGMDGRLHCFGKGVGFGIPYATQLTNPHRFARADCGQYSCDQQIDQAEPNGLFMPAAADATWYMLIDPKTGKASPTYVEPHLTVTTFPLTGPSVAEPCPSKA